MTIDQTAAEISLSVATTEALEQELRDRSEALSRHQVRFALVRDELKRRRETKDEQPPMQVTTVESQQKVDADLNRTLTLKITEMEGQQAKLVVEAEIAKAAQREAEDRLALVAKTVRDFQKAYLDETHGDRSPATVMPIDVAQLREAFTEQCASLANAVNERDAYRSASKREPMTRYNARMLGLGCKYKKGTATGTIDEWVIDAIVEASR